MKQEEQRHHSIVSEFIDDYDKIGYRYLPNSSFISVRDKTYLINSLGFRDDEFDSDTTGVRVAIIGDSVFEGFGVAKADRASDIAETVLSRVYIDNFCISGSSTLDELEIFNQYVLSRHPKLAILQLCFNDFEHNYNVINNIKKEETSKDMISFKSFFQNHSAFYLFLAEKYSYFKLSDNQPNTLLKSILDMDNKKTNTTFDLIRQFKKTCAENSIIPLLVYSPYEAEVLINDAKTGMYLSDKIGAFCKTNQLDYISLTPILRTQKSQLFFDQCHLNEKGNRIAGEFLATELALILRQFN